MKNSIVFLCTLFFLFSSTAKAQNIALDSFAFGFNAPLDIQNAGDDRLFVIEQQGTIQIVNPNGSINSTPFLDISNLTNGNGENSELGLLGLAFHPNYANNGYFFVHYTDNMEDTQISRFSVSTTNPDIANPSSELPIIGYEQPFSNHNAGAIAFGPDGFLYISSGDGGDVGDPGNRAQNTSLLLGKLLRIDVDAPSNGNNYGIPTDNPFAGSSSEAEEIWAYGLRNPFKFSFDVSEGNVWIADVGQNTIEEINRQPISEAGVNYGWRCYEGSQAFNTSNCPNTSQLAFPFTEYNQANIHCSVTGGYVYRGTIYSDIQGHYFFADFCSGMIASVDNTGNQVDYGDFNGGGWSSFGVDTQGELYIANLFSGGIFKIEGTVLSANDNELTNITIAPNPSTERVTIQSQNNLIEQIEIIDLRGRVLISKDAIASNTHSINIQNIPSGIYMVRITSQNKISVKKLTVQ